MTAIPQAVSRLLLILLLYSGIAGAETGPGGDFSLIDHTQRPFHLEDHRGNVILLFFGYTFCPDICPTELATIASILRKFQDDPVQGVFVTVDPGRDTSEKLNDYVSYFSNRLIGLTGTPEQIDRVKSAYKVRSTINRKTPDDIYYSVDHTANLYVIDQGGQLVNIVPYGFPAEHVVDILEQLIDTGVQ